MEELLSLLQSKNIQDYEITDKHYGYTHVRKLKILYIYNKFIHDPSDFEKLGYGIIHKERGNENCDSAI